MAYAIDDVVAEVCAGVNARWRGIDPLSSATAWSKTETHGTGTLAWIATYLEC